MFAAGVCARTPSRAPRVRWSEPQALKKTMVYRNMTPVSSFADLSDRDLLVEVKRLAGAERRATAGLIASLAEIDARRLYLGEGCTSLFTYCTRILHLSEDAAYGRIEVARAARKFPVILDLLADGVVTLTAVSRVARHLTVENQSKVLESIRHKSKREVQELVAALHPQPDVPAIVRKLPAPQVPLSPVFGPMHPEAEASGITARSRVGEVALTYVLPRPAPPPAVGAPPVVAARPAVVAPLAPERYKVQFTVSRETHDKLRHAQDLLRHVVPNGDPAEIFDRALTLLVQHAERTKLAAAKRPRRSAALMGRARRIPSDVKRAVWKRDDGRCGFVGSEGQCAERGFLEFHHVVPYAKGGPATIENIALRCRAHNQHHAHEVFGAKPLHVREAAAQYGGCAAASVRTEWIEDAGLWKLPDLWTHRAAPTRSLENAQHAFSTATTGPFSFRSSNG